MYIKRDKVLGQSQKGKRILLSLDTKTGIVGEHEYCPELVEDCSNAVLRNGNIHFLDRVEKPTYIKYADCRICYKGDEIHIYKGGKYHIVGGSNNLGVLNLVHIDNGMLLYIDGFGERKVLNLSGGIKMGIKEFRRRLTFESG